MCYPEGSVSHAVNDCPLCKAFVHSRCPHVREVCRNRALHPQLDVVYLKNAEVDWFNGCGYCKWARLNSSQKPAGFLNPGWPGCCRPPAPSEYRMIQAADWRSVSVVHHIPIPPEIKALLDGLTTGGRSASKSSMPPLDRKNSGGNAGTGGGSPPTKASNTVTKSPSAVNKSRTSISPKTPAATLSKATSNAMEGIRNSPDKEKPYNNSAHSSPGRKHVDLDTNLTPRRNSGSSPDSRSVAIPLSKGSPDLRSSAIPFSKCSPDSRSYAMPSGKRSPESRSSAIPLGKRSPDSRASILPSSRGSQESRSSLERHDAASILSGGSGGSDSLSDSTVTSDGGFTDYLSDESEAELQRQAEARAALLAQNQAEELEFKAARQQLAHVDLRPPKSWNPTNITNSNTAPRLTTTTKG
ncbi:hypothetical protein J3R30DRAFT_3387825 [Lentinula aciculospora]|uniref:Uncharacterized protein n=1 Tax=Lentinula aciculospora TaxID=153920 RepID=A0A9W8ZUV2_9AGAR|nr:hypothetical protein J3R30DRAFT_3387825 [Lentinula aciculospora]